MPTTGHVRLTSLFPGLGLALLSKFTCSACLGAYSGLLASVGVGFVATDSGLTILTVALLGLGLAGVAWSTRRHNHPGPFALVAIGSGLVLVSRLTSPSTLGLLTGAVLLLGGSLWNLWLERRIKRCSATLPAEVRKETIS
ncbi:MAG: MerC family mercury resistance protein [Gemmatimonadales bacterium]